VTVAEPARPVRGAPGYVIDWEPPAGRPDWLMGAGTTRGERATVWVGTVLGVAAVVSGAPQGWSWWQWGLVVVLAADLVGGVVANSLSTAKRQYHGGHAPAARRSSTRVLRSSTVFASAHVHPFVVALLLPDASWRWAAGWYVGCVVSVFLVHRVPLHLQRPTAFAAVAVLLVAAPLVAAPEGLAWFGPVLAVKLVGAHAVREEPYRPASSQPRDSSSPG
jgi:hypothetical protein